MEEFIIEELLKALRRYPDLKITLLFDYSRSSRIEEGKSSYQFLSRLLTEVSNYSNHSNHSNLVILRFLNMNHI